jgi:actin related protein 2/3 complex subunit 5
VTTAVKSSDIDKHLDALDDLQVDLLLKYVYKGMAEREGEHFNSMLAWHEAIVKRTGLGSIIRAMAERRNVL